MSNCDWTEWCAHAGAAKARLHNKAVKRIILPPIHLRGASQDNSEYSKATPTLFCDGARPHLELHNLRSCALAAFLVPGRVHRVARPEPAALPAGFRVVDPSGRVTGSKTQRVRYA